MMKNFLLVGLGGALGSMGRYGISLLASSIGWTAFAGTLTANVIGSFLIGLIYAACASGSWQLMLTVGFCGGFTTFSTFSHQSLSLIQQGNMGMALGYMLCSFVACLLFVWLGMQLGQQMGS